MIVFICLETEKTIRTERSLRKSKEKKRYSWKREGQIQKRKETHKKRDLGYTPKKWTMLRRLLKVSKNTQVWRCQKALSTVCRIPDNLLLNFTCCLVRLPKFLNGVTSQLRSGYALYPKLWWFGANNSHHNNQKGSSAFLLFEKIAVKGSMRYLKSATCIKKLFFCKNLPQIEFHLCTCKLCTNNVWYCHIWLLILMSPSGFTNNMET